MHTQIKLPLLSGLLLITMFFPPLAQAEIIPGMPDAIVCSVKDPTGVLPWERMVFYVSAQMRDARTLYKSATSDPVLLFVTADGVVRAANLADCDGRSVASLREEGRAFSFVSSRSNGAQR